ncbi:MULTISPECIES: VOC family protein [Chelativorans]|jgi:lactoylglutathione lyase|uniref:Glyoxalase/bleomycin resistance protein/dioxygenase n=1 Tax=Chelativorans sp. (strain BNC1) TaxID=266779 RepID=Q11JG8_CHESB|nr:MULTISPECIES: VOC family protein [Chelativorans]
MAFRINHIHFKSRDPKQSADWFVKAFNFMILTDEVRQTGDRFIRCMTEDNALRVNFSGERNGEKLPEAIVGPHLGLEHFGIDSADIHADVARLSALGAILNEGPRTGRGGQMVAFMQSPDGFRIELMQQPKK